MSFGQVQDDMDITLSKSHQSYIQHPSTAGLMDPTSFSRDDIEHTIPDEPGYRQYVMGGFVCWRTTSISGACFYPFSGGPVLLPSSTS